MQNSLPQRSEAVLKALVEAYLHEGEPVGSRLLAERMPETVSSATIRNVLADLEGGAMVSQPHISAGRIPTERAYRYYVDHWVQPEQPQIGDQRLATLFDGLEQDPELWLRHASKMLSEIMGGICVALPVHLAQSQLLKLEFVPLGERRIVAVWVGINGDVEHQVMENRWSLEANQLIELSNFASTHFKGHSLEGLRQALLKLLQNHALEARALVKRLSEVAEQLEQSKQNAAQEPHVVISGLRELLKMPEFDDGRRFRELVEAFEEHHRLARLLNAFAEASSRELQLLLGSENPYLPSMSLATAMRTVPVPGLDSATFAFIGPLRQDYGRLLGTLLWWSREMERRHRGCS